MRSQCLRDAESRTLAETGECVIERPVKPQPWMYESGQLVWEYGTGIEEIRKQMLEHCPLGQPGEQRWCRETWMLYDLLVDGITRKPDRYRITYKARKDGYATLTQWLSSPTALKAMETGYMAEGLWRSPVTMPRWASRFTVKVLSTEAIQRDGVWYWTARVRRVEV